MLQKVNFWINSLQVRSLWFRDRCWAVYSLSAVAYLTGGSGCQLSSSYSWNPFRLYGWEVLSVDTYVYSRKWEAEFCEHLKSSMDSFVPAIFLLDRGKGMFAEVCCSFYMCRTKTWYKCFNARMENIWMFCWVSRRILACSDLTVEKYKAWSSISAFLVSQSR